MKTRLLFLPILFLTLTMNAQFSVETADSGDPIVDGSVFNFNTVDYPAAALGYFVNNLSTTDEIYMRIEVVSFTNTDGTMMELCFGDCYSGVSLQSYPINSSVTIQPGSTQTSTGDHFFNMDPGNGTDVITYVFRFFQVDGSLNEIGDDLTFTYNFDPLLNAADAKELEVSVYPTVANETVNVTLKEAATVQVIDLRGRVVMTQKLEAGTSAMQVSNLPSQSYLLQFTTEQGASQVTKIVVQ